MKPMLFALLLALSLPWTDWALAKEPFSSERFAAPQAENQPRPPADTRNLE